jgi:hypothetical protein
MMTPGTELCRDPWVAMVDLPSASRGPGVVAAPSRAGDAHEHNYERFAPQAPDGTLDTLPGIREFVVKTGGGGDYDIGTPVANSEVCSMEHSVLKLTLTESVDRWQFIRISGDSASRDSGTAV